MHLNLCIKMFLHHSTPRLKLKHNPKKNRRLSCQDLVNVQTLMQSTTGKMCTARYIRVNVTLTNWMMTSVTKRIRGIHIAGTRAIQEVILHMANWSLLHNVCWDGNEADWLLVTWFNVSTTALWLNYVSLQRKKGCVNFNCFNLLRHNLWHPAQGLLNQKKTKKKVGVRCAVVTEGIMNIVCDGNSTAPSVRTHQ